ncbi:MAG TPA: hypothetical protein VLS48_06785, partial [Anaerolineales bacterium]|nr:hypothetical protein [Anaerolineales bacterium]
MDRQISGKRPHFRPVQRRSNFYRVMLLLSLILGSVWVLLGFQRGQVQPLFQPTPTPTRVARSYLMEAEAYFDAGIIDNPSNNRAGVEAPPVNDAIEAYQAALALEPDNLSAWIELARIQAYSSAMLRNDADRLERLKGALEAATRAAELA